MTLTTGFNLQMTVFLAQGDGHPDQGFDGVALRASQRGAVEQLGAAVGAEIGNVRNRRGGNAGAVVGNTQNQPALAFRELNINDRGDGGIDAFGGVQGIVEQFLEGRVSPLIRLLANHPGQIIQREIFGLLGNREVFTFQDRRTHGRVSRRRMACHGYNALRVASKWGSSLATCSTSSTLMSASFLT
jgi:hypothetical protein